MLHVTICSDIQPAKQLGRNSFKTQILTSENFLNVCEAKRLNMPVH